MKVVRAFSIDSSVAEIIDDEVRREGKSRSRYVEDLLKEGLGLRGFRLKEADAEVA